MRRSRLIFVAALFLLLHLSACTHLLPLRTSASAATCDSDKEGNLIAAGRPGYDEECASTAHERTADYDLLFVEFDDQGLLYPPTAQDRRRQFQVGPQQFEAAATETRDADAGSAGIQIGLTLSRLRELARADPSTHDGLSILVYVHGWKHNAAADDDDVKGFRKALKTIALVERARIRLARQNGNRTALPRRAVGI